MFKLVIQDDEGKTTVVPLIRDEITIGRKEGNTIRLTERNVSRRHARILRNNGEVQIEDLGSYNGIRVNNARIAERVSLRVSDQVQIGDYKLYLKAEGVEQVDDARTMPIERIENGQPTEVMAAVPAAPTTPMPAQATPAAAPAATAARGIGVADTDPGGRPVATAAQVAALTQPATYGKLVVISSNFAGKEFDLTRPQMIVGRTDENDFVVNHRSISRNHAKITRDPETQRYTISDLQSSNGVRVNGQDYGKVELRRGDVVDLGHVRLRFVEPGEDFVFSPSMVTDVHEPGGKKGLFIAVVLALLVLGGAGAFYVMRGKPGGHGTTGSAAGQPGSAAVAVNPGSGGSDTHVIAEAPIDAAPAPTTNPTDDQNQLARSIKTECHGYLADKKWTDLQTCADKLKKLDPAEYKELAAKAKEEMGYALKVTDLEDALRDGNLAKARKILDQIAEDSVYKVQAKQEYSDAEAKVVAKFRSRALALKRAHRCSDLDTLADQAGAESAKAADAVRDVKCETPPPPPDCSSSLREPGDRKCLKQFCASHAGDSHCGGGSSSGCDPAPLKAQGMKKQAMGEHGAAVTLFEASLRCHFDPYVNKLAFMEACNAGDVGKARIFYRRLTSSEKTLLIQMCVRNGITAQKLQP